MIKISKPQESLESRMRVRDRPVNNGAGSTLMPLADTTEPKNKTGMKNALLSLHKTMILQQTL